MSRARVTARKIGGDDRASWAVLIDGRIFVSGLTRPEVAYYKTQAAATLAQAPATMPRHDAAPVFPLVYAEDRRPVKVGAKLHDFRGNTWTLVGWEYPHKPASTGRVYVRDAAGGESSFYPSVIGLEFWPRPDRD